MWSTVDTLKVVVAKRGTIVAALLLLELVMIVAVANTPFLSGERAGYQQQYNSITPTLKENPASMVVTISSHNFLIAAIEQVPIIGPILFFYSIYGTARIVEIVGASSPEGVLVPLLTLFVLPHTWLELPGYALGVTESLYLTRAIFAAAVGDGARLRKEWRFLAVNTALIAGLLIVAAIFEVAEIQLEEGPPTTEALVFLSWVPFVAIALYVRRFWRSARLEAPGLEERYVAASTAAGPQGTGPVVIKPGVVHSCPNCGWIFAGDPKFCAICGRPLSSPVDSGGIGGTGARAPGEDGAPAEMEGPGASPRRAPSSRDADGMENQSTTAGAGRFPLRLSVRCCEEKSKTRVHFPRRLLSSAGLGDMSHRSITG